MQALCKKAINFLVSLLVIIGPVGSGKTAFARMVYRRWRNRRAAWVTVSDKPDMKWILEEILRQVMKSPLQGTEKYDVEQLSHKLRKELKNEWSLIVLDSLWSVEYWQTIKDALFEMQFVVVVTTRNKEVAEECFDVPKQNKFRYRYVMHPLLDVDLEKLSEQLLSTERIGRASWPLWFSVRKLILDTCPVPLALKCICGVLAGVDMDFDWLTTLKSDLYLVKDSFTDPEDRTKEVLKYCWRKYLPSWLQQCSQDLISILPEGYAINRKKLMRLWIAKGFVNPGGGLSVEDVAGIYFDELISRCIIVPESVNHSGNVRRCLINDVFKELIAPLPIPGTYPGDNQSQLEHDRDGSSSVDDEELQNHESVNPANNKQVPQSEKQNPGNEQEVPNPDIVAFQLYNISPSAALDFVKEQLFSIKPELLTFLDLEGCKGLSNNELNKLCNFVQLRFLSLRNTDVHHLPEKIGELKLLETLDIRRTKIKKMPGGIVRLDRLKHLLAGNVYKPERVTGIDSVPCSRAVEVSMGIKKMQALQTLAHVNATRASKILHAVRELTQLKKLGLVIREEELNFRPLCISIMMLSASLHSLSVCDERKGGSLDFLEYLCFPPLKLESLNLRGRLGRIPQWIADHRRLTKITLSHTQLGSNDLKLLGGIRSLLCLKLYSESFLERTLVLCKDEFNALQVLVVHCDAIRTIRFEEGATPSLEVFKWVLFHNRTGNTQGIEKLPMLKDVSLIGNSGIENRTKMATILRDHENHDTLLALNFIEKEIWDNPEDETETKTKTKNSNCFWG